jgi:hypothetical protein
MKKSVRLIVILALAVSLLPTSAPAATKCFTSDNTRAKRLMRGDLDGDAIRDSVWLGARRDGRCHYFVFAETSSSGRSRVAIPANDRFSRSSLRFAGRPIALVKLDDIPGREVAVHLLAGASVQPFGFFTMRLGRLRRMPIDDTAPQPLAGEDMFAYGGGLALMFGTDCAFGKSPRTLVYSRAYPKNAARTKYFVERRWYQVRGFGFARTSHPMQKEVVRLSRLRARFHEFRNGGLLARCEGHVLRQ